MPIPVCPTCKLPLTLGGDEYDEPTAKLTFGTCCGEPVIGQCLACAKVYHPAGTLWIPHAGATYRRLASDKEGDTPFPRMCGTCAVGQHDSCLKAWMLKPAAFPKPLRYICVCQDASHSADAEIDWSAVIVHGDDTPPNE